MVVTLFCGQQILKIIHKFKMFRVISGIKFLRKFSNKNYLKLAKQNASFSAANITADKRFMIVDINKSENASNQCEQFKYPLIWLRDNCQCSSCFHAQSKSRTIEWTQFDFKNAQPKSISIDKQLQVTWKDDHVSTFDIKWLYERNFTAENRRNYLDNHYRATPKLWSKDQFEMKEFNAVDVFENDDALYEWLITLTKYGVVMLKNANFTEDQVRRLINRVGFIRETHYGKEYAVRADPNATNVAYTSNPLQLHADLPYYDYTPGVTLLHCINQTKSPGAFNSLVDGFYVAELLKKQNPKAFHYLSTTLVNWSDYGTQDDFRFEKIMRKPVICLDYEGKMIQINHSIPQRDTIFSIDAETVDEWYYSLKAYVDLLYKEAVYFKTEPGSILAFSNIRLLHGRTGYEDKDGDIRHLVGGYMDWDEIYSRLRVLANDKQMKS